MNDPTSAVIAISSYLREQYNAPSSVLGASLGSKIQLRFPEVNLRMAFGGLRGLIIRYLQPFVREIGRSGSDYVYQIDFSLPNDGRPATYVTQQNLSGTDAELRYTDLVTSSPNSERAAQDATRINLWSILTNPKLARSLYWDAGGNGLVESYNMSGTTTLPIVQPISLEEHCAITQDYLSHKGISIPLSEADPHDVKTYVPKAVNVLRKKGVISDWESYRTDAILKVLAGRLIEIGVGDSQVAALLSMIRDTKPRAPWFSKLGNSLQNIQTSSSAPNQLSEQKLRELFITAIKLMPIEELRELKISGATIEKSLAQH